MCTEGIESSAGWKGHSHTHTHTHTHTNTHTHTHTHTCEHTLDLGFTELLFIQIDIDLCVMCGAPTARGRQCRMSQKGQEESETRE